MQLSILQVQSVTKIVSTLFLSSPSSLQVVCQYIMPTLDHATTLSARHPESISPEFRMLMLYCANTVAYENLYLKDLLPCNM